MTARELSAALEITPAAVRRHLDALEAEGVVQEYETSATPGSRGRGRPARAWVLSGSGHESLPMAYDGIAIEALSFIDEAFGRDAVRGFARRRANALTSRHEDRVDGVGKDPTARARALAEGLREDGFAATIRDVPGATGVQLCQGHCPVQHVAREFPELCKAEADAFSALLGVPVQRLQTLPAGGHVCTTFVPSAAPGTGPVPPSTENPPSPEERSR